MEDQKGQQAEDGLVPKAELLGTEQLAAAADSVPWLEARDLQLSFGQRRVLQGLSLQLFPGEFVCLVGPNGAGKTTLLECLAGVREVQAGSVLLAGKELASYQNQERARQMALLGREARGELSLSVQSVVELGRLPHRSGWGLSEKDRTIVRDCLERLDCAQFAERRLYALSDGERQRVQWARALCQEPHGLLLDEATAHLDLAHRERSFARAREFTQAGGTVLAVAHDLDLALRHAGRVIVLNEGQIVADSSPIEALSTQILAEVFQVRAQVRQTEQGVALFVEGVIE